MIHAYQFKNNYENVRQSFVKLQNGLSRALNALNQEEIQLSEEEQAAAEALQGAINTLADPESGQLSVIETQELLDTVENNAGFFRLQFGEEGKTVFDRTRINPETIQDINRTLGQRFDNMQLDESYRLASDALCAIDFNKLKFTDPQDEFRFHSVMNALSVIGADPKNEKAVENSSITTMQDGTEVSVKGFPMASRILSELLYNDPAMITPETSFWNMEVTLDGKKRKIGELAAENAKDKIKEKIIQQSIAAVTNDYNRVYGMSAEIDYLENVDIPNDLYDDVIELDNNYPKAVAEQDFPFLHERNEDRDLDMTAIGKIPSTAANAESAYRHIDVEKNSLKQTLQDAKNNEGDIYKADIEDHIATILAARMLSNAERNSPETLNVNMTAKQIENMAEQIKKTEGFQAFMSKMDDDRKFFRKVAEAGLDGHGGKLEILMKNFLKNREPGEFEPEPVLDRWNPTALERIEALQKQIKKPNEVDALQNNAKAAAEIIAARNAVKANRGDKSSLNKKIPSDITYSDVYDKLTSDGLFEDMCNSNDMVDLMKTGHGGEMLDRMREVYPTIEDYDTDSMQMLNENTIEGRMNRLRYEAIVLQQRYDRVTKIRQRDSDGELKEKELQDPQIKILKEYLALSTALHDKQGNYKAENLKANVPWKSVNKSLKEFDDQKIVDKVLDNSTLEEEMDKIIKGNKEAYAPNTVEAVNNYNRENNLPEYKSKIKAPQKEVQQEDIGPNLAP